MQMDQPISKRERAKRLIRDLLAKTVENGATEAEAMASAAKANDLMLQYDLTIEDAQEIRDDTYGAYSKTVGGGSHKRVTWHEMVETGFYIARFTNTKRWRSGQKYIFFGSKQDTEIAHFLLETFINCANFEWSQHKKRRNVDTSIRGRKSFMRGMVHRIEERLTALIKEREDALKAQSKTGTALMVVKQQVVLEKFETYSKQSGLRLRTTSTTKYYDPNSGNYAAGKAAGDRVNIGTGVGQTATARLR